MRYEAKLSAAVEFARFREVAATPLCHAARVFERAEGEYWLETSESVYRLLISKDGFVTGAISKGKPCSELLDLIDIFGLSASITKFHEDGEEPNADWESVSKRYDPLPNKGVRESHTERSQEELSPVEEEVLRAIQLLVGSTNTPVDIGQFASGFGTNLSVTLRSLAKKGYIGFCSEEESDAEPEDAEPEGLAVFLLD